MIPKCCICNKQLVRGDFVYGACHECAHIAIEKASVYNGFGSRLNIKEGAKQ